MATRLKDEICAFVQAEAEAQISFVIGLCNENSYTYNAEGTNRVAGMVLSRLEDLFTVHETIDQTEVGNHHILRTASPDEPSDEKSIYNKLSPLTIWFMLTGRAGEKPDVIIFGARIHRELIEKRSIIA